MGLHAWYDRQPGQPLRRQVWITFFLDPDTGEEDRYYDYSACASDNRVRQIKADGLEYLRTEIK